MPGRARLGVERPLEDPSPHACESVSIVGPVACRLGVLLGRAEPTAQGGLTQSAQGDLTRFQSVAIFFLARKSERKFPRSK